MGAGAVTLFQDRYGALRQGASLGALGELLRAFANLPYENFSKIIAWHSRPQGPVRDPVTVMSDHLALGTGGTCFSLTELLRHLLVAAGFCAQPVMAHMRHGANIHCALRVEVAGHGFLVDPGYLLQEPVSLSSCPARSFRPEGRTLLVRAGVLPGVPASVPQGDFDLFTVENGELRWRYRFSDKPASSEEFLYHWRRSFTLPGMRSLLATRRSDDELLYLHNHKLRRQSAGGGARMQNLRAELPESLQEIFGIDPEVTRRALELLQAQRERWRAGRAHGPLSPRDRAGAAKPLRASRPRAHETNDSNAKHSDRADRKRG